MLFNSITIIGGGLIGSSLARAVKQLGLARAVVIGDCNAAHAESALRHGFADEATDDLTEAVRAADLVVLATPVGTFGAIAEGIAPYLPAGCIVTDVGSVKQAVVDAVEPHIPAHASFVPAHPIAGTEHAGPDAGFAELFQNRWCILTPTAQTPLAALNRVQALWEAVGATVAVLDVQHHDDIFAMASHLPTLLNVALVNSTGALGAHGQAEVLQYAASGFRGATRLAAQDPTVWRDIFLTNREALLRQLEICQEEISTLARAIRWGDATTLDEMLVRARDVRKGLRE